MRRGLITVCAAALAATAAPGAGVSGHATCFGWLNVERVVQTSAGCH